MRGLEKVKKIDFYFVGSVIVAWTLSSVALSSTIGGNNLIYAIGELQAYDKSLFNGNMYLGEGVISPRYIIDALFKIIMRINGGSWAGAELLWIYFGVLVEAVAIANISYRINKKRSMAVSAILSCLILYCNNYLAAFSLNELVSTSIGVGIGFSILSISFLVGDRRYDWAWIFAACAVICHVHEGIYCCCVVFIIALIDSIVQHKLLIKDNRLVIVAILSLMIIILPSLITDHADISDSEFVYIYSIFRHPHHLVPSTWDIDSIYKTIWVDIALFIISIAECKLINIDKTKQRLYEAIALVCAWIAAILIMYIFTEINPIAFVSTLFFSKSFKYVLLIALILLVFSAMELREKGLYGSSYLFIYYGFLVTAFELKMIFIVTIFVILVMCVEQLCFHNGIQLIHESFLKYTDICFFILMICIKRETLGISIGFLINLLFSFKDTFYGLSQGLTVLFVFFAIYAISKTNTKWKNFNKTIFVVTCACMFMTSLFGKILIYDGEKISLISGEYALRITMGDDLYALAKDFKSGTDVNDEYLANPDDATNAGWFQIVSQRNCFVIFKVVPSSKATLDDWYTRYMETTSFDEKSGAEIAEIMNREGLKYLLLNADNYSKIDEEREYSIFLSSPSDSFRIYQLN